MANRWVVTFMTACLALCANRASAAPIEADGRAAHTSGETDGARDRAIAAARRSALDRVIASIEGELQVDPTAVAKVLERADAWTAGYRVLEVREQAGELAVTIEAEIDIPRLRKRIAAKDESSSTRTDGFVWGGVESDGCSALDEAGLAEPLRAYGVVSDAQDGPTTLTLTVRCVDQGAVSHTHVQAAFVEIAAETRGDVALERTVSGRGFAETAADAQALALDRALGELGDQLAVEARGDLELRVERPWPAARVGVLETTLRQAVLGVDAAELAGIAPDGTAILRISGSIDVTGLGQQLQGLSFPGFGLVGLRVDTAHALRVRMQ